jgi:ABC-2 type transport system permease protein
MQATADVKSLRPSAARGLGLIVRRELGVYFGSPSGYVIAALMLLVTGLLFNVLAVGTGQRFSAEVLSDFFKNTSGITMIFSPLIAMRLLAEERQSGTLPLLLNSSMTEGEIVAAKFLSAWLFLIAILAVSVYMPALIFIRGKVSIAQIFAGYLGLALLGGAVIAIGTFGSAIAKSQVVAVVVSGTITALLTICWMLSKVVEGTLGEVASGIALWDKHFTPFMRGTVDLADIVYYLSVIALFLMLARNALEARRWAS